MSVPADFLLVTTIRVTPGVRPITTPVVLTLAIEAFRLRHVTGELGNSAPPESRTTAVSRVDMRTLTTFDSGTTASDSTPTRMESRFGTLSRDCARIQALPTCSCARSKPVGYARTAAGFELVQVTGW